VQGSARSASRVLHAALPAAAPPWSHQLGGVERVSAAKRGGRGALCARQPAASRRRPSGTTDRVKPQLRRRQGRQQLPCELPRRGMAARAARGPRLRLPLQAQQRQAPRSRAGQHAAAVKLALQRDPERHLARRRPARLAPAQAHPAQPLHALAHLPRGAQTRRARASARARTCPRRAATLPPRHSGRTGPGRKRPNPAQAARVFPNTAYQNPMHAQLLVPGGVLLREGATLLSGSGIHPAGRQLCTRPCAALGGGLAATGWAPAGQGVQRCRLVCLIGSRPDA